MVLIFKKGDPSNCGNYRPITLLCIGYKIIVSILLRRLKQRRAENKVWITQFGFKSHSGTFDTLFFYDELSITCGQRKQGVVFLLR